MNNDLELIDVSEEKVNKKNDRFMMVIYFLLILLVVLGLITYFFGYEVLKPIIRV